MPKLLVINSCTSSYINVSKNLGGPKKCDVTYLIEKSEKMNKKSEK